jgi:hypothetical protein
MVQQTGTDFKTRYKEQINDIKSNKDKYRYALQILQENHECGPIDKIMNILKLQSKVNIWMYMKYFVFIKLINKRSIMNEQHVEVNNVLFDPITD